MAVCIGCKQSDIQSDDFITVDVMANYPKKELILQDFMDVEYIPLETNNDFVNQGIVMDIGEKFIIIVNRINDGDIFLYDRNGKALRKINRFGQGGEEYTNITSIILDEDDDEMFINQRSERKILVYDLYGNFKRSFNHKDSVMYRRVFKYDKDNLICDDGSYHTEGERNEQSFFIISKKDGSIVSEIKIPFKKEKSTLLMKTDENRMEIVGFSYYSIISHRGNWMLTVPSSDTIFECLPDQNIIPFIVRKPSIQSMDPEVFLHIGILTDYYYFMSIVTKEYDFVKGGNFPAKHLIYDRQEKKIYEYSLINDDFIKKRNIILDISGAKSNDEILFSTKIETDYLIETYRKGELKGKLKEIAADLDEDSNPVIMIIKHKL